MYYAIHSLPAKTAMKYRLNKFDKNSFSPTINFYFLISIILAQPKNFSFRTYWIGAEIPPDEDFFPSFQHSNRKPSWFAMVSLGGRRGTSRAGKPRVSCRSDGWPWGGLRSLRTLLIAPKTHNNTPVIILWMRVCISGWAREEKIEEMEQCRMLPPGDFYLKIRL